MFKYLSSTLMIIATLTLAGCYYDGPEEMAAYPVQDEVVQDYGTITMTNATNHPIQVEYNHWHAGLMDGQHLASFGPNESKTFQLSYDNTTFKVVRIISQGQEYLIGEDCSVNLEPDQLNGAMVLNPDNAGEKCFVNYS
jgi:hypothetical protein